ncbi:hypothetical protein BC827DRAFT_1215366 [Russula dissimulans]|nr:hypothetical protein BC827DRAFT_1215366 [Russula dissimulans]
MWVFRLVSRLINLTFQQSFLLVLGTQFCQTHSTLTRGVTLTLSMLIKTLLKKRMGTGGNAGKDALKQTRRASASSRGDLRLGKKVGTE